MTDQTFDHRTAWEDYVRIWKLPGEDEKRAACAHALHPECVYTDPLTRREGREALVAYMLQFHQDVPGGHFVTTSFLAHHRRSLAHWNMVGGDGTVLGTGASYAEYGDDGKLVAMNGFFAAQD